MMEIEALSSDRMAGRSEILVLQPDLQQQKQQSCPAYPRLTLLWDCRWRNSYSSLCLLIRHSFHGYSHLWIHHNPTGLLSGQEEFLPLFILYPQETRSEDRWVQIYYSFSMNSPGFQSPDFTAPYHNLKLTVSPNLRLRNLSWVRHMDFQSIVLWWEHLLTSLENWYSLSQQGIEMCSFVLDKLGLWTLDSWYICKINWEIHVSDAN